MAIDAKAFFAESKRLQDEQGLTRDAADKIVADRFWDGVVDEKMRPTEGEIVSAGGRRERVYIRMAVFAAGGMMLDHQGNRSIFDDIDK
jgi:hypothetical protein